MRVVISLMLSLYVGYALYSIFPYTDTFIAGGAAPLMKFLVEAAVFVAATLLAFFFIRRVIGGSYGRSPFVPLILVVLALGFLMAVGYQLFGIAHLYAFPPLVDTLFAPKAYFFWWFAAPLVGLLLLARGR